MYIIDLHCDTLTNLNRADEFRVNKHHIDLQKLMRGGCLAQCFAIYIPKSNSRNEFAYFNDYCNLFYSIINKNKRYILPAVSAKGIDYNKSKNKMSAILTVEDGDLLGGDLRKLDHLANCGVKIITFTWNEENCLGYPHTYQGEKYGLKPFGIEALEQMNKYKIIPDVSHLSVAGFWDVVKYSKSPFIASHSCANSLHRHTRNLTDPQLKAIGNCGGVVGINFYAQFLNGGNLTMADDIIRHIEKTVNTAGIDAAALGSDFDGIDCMLEFENYSGYQVLADKISKKFGSDNAEKICYKNALRILNG